ncbi:MAG: hypothetical protein FJW26_20595, partial [Acidimicrobiia bacterium]|nr:hypothetical protein [Acidimicrobiia bacterium]
MKTRQKRSAVAYGEISVWKKYGVPVMLLMVTFGLLPSVRPVTVEASKAKDAARDCRLMFSWDQMEMWRLQLAYAHRGKTPEPGAVKTMLEQIVDEHAKARVDRIVHCFFALPRGTVPPGLRSFYRDPIAFSPYQETDSGARQLENAGYDFAQILLDRSRQKGMEFLGGLRMNDRHGDAGKTEFGKAHPEWVLT